MQDDVVAPAGAGTISGKVHAEGKLAAEQDAQCGKYDSRALKFAERVNYSGLRDFLVFIDEGPVGTNKSVAPDKPVQVVTNKREVPKVATLRHMCCTGRWLTRPVDADRAVFTRRVLLEQNLQVDLCRGPRSNR